MTTVKAKRFNIQRPDVHALPPLSKVSEQGEPLAPKLGAPKVVMPEAHPIAAPRLASDVTAAPKPAATAPVVIAAIQPVQQPAAQVQLQLQPDSGHESAFGTPDDGFGDLMFDTARDPRTDPTPAPLGHDTAQSDAPLAEGVEYDDPTIQASIEAIRAEGLTGRQLRTATRHAMHLEMSVTSRHDAVRQLRDRGLDPFQRGTLLDMITPIYLENAPADGGAPPASRSLTTLPGDNTRLPQTIKPGQLPSTERRPEVNHAAEILRMQKDLLKRRRRKVALLFARMFVFVLLPTILAGWYFATVATKQYGVKTEFAVQMAESPLAASKLGGLLQGTSMATAQDSIAIQGYLQSRAAMLRLEADDGFRTHFQGEGIDPLLRLSDDATMEESYRLFRKQILISYDPTEGIIRMEVIAPSADQAVQWSNRLIKYAEEQVDKLTIRLREDTMKGAHERYIEAEEAVKSSQQKVITLQEQYKMISSESEAAMLSAQIGNLENEIMVERLSLAQMDANPNPNQARMEPIKRRIASLEEQINIARKRLTEGDAEGRSLAQIQGELLMAQADVETRRLMLAQGLQAMESSRIDANRQTRYLSTNVSPIPPDEPTYPRIFENTLVSLLILLGIYLMVSMTFSILREQVSS